MTVKSFEHRLIKVTALRLPQAEWQDLIDQANLAGLRPSHYIRQTLRERSKAKDPENELVSG